MVNTLLLQVVAGRQASLTATNDDDAVVWGLFAEVMLGSCELGFGSERLREADVHFTLAE
ncbi:hypothetical protein ULF88_18360 [Halopseudomonas pachastrellae]|nr:hypothetical protein [Halopseudomonas pachastrellae]